MKGPLPVDTVTRYFERTYPRLRGVGDHTPFARLTRRFTEPGRSERLAWVLRELESFGPGSVLDAGCGEGLYALALAARGHDVTAVDLSAAMLERAASSAATQGLRGRIELVKADLRSWDRPARFDTVLCIGVAEYDPQPALLLDRLFARTRRLMLLSVTLPSRSIMSSVRRAWLLNHGLDCSAFDRKRLEGLLSPLPGTIRIAEIGGTSCVAIRRSPVIVAPASGDGDRGAVAVPPRALARGDRDTR